MKLGRGSSHDDNVWPPVAPGALIQTRTFRGSIHIFIGKRGCRLLEEWGRGARVYSDCQRPRPHAYITEESDGTHPRRPGSPSPGKTVTLTDCQLPRRATTSPPETVSADLSPSTPAAPHFPAICPAGGRNNPWIPGLITGEWVLPSCGVPMWRFRRGLGSNGPLNDWWMHYFWKVGLVCWEI